MDLVEGSSVVITGAASGIGEGLARECVNRGLRVALADVEKAPLDALVDQLLAALGEPSRPGSLTSPMVPPSRHLLRAWKQSSAV
ncbi:hypothetical protein CM1200mP19_0510 [bacterium]|nr:MAG: hypothetical protein CM1200mP19_0510 [bacterium]